jgi:diadenosine tetraphosphate (Ap4A) HIT family hydrolase
MDGCFTCEVNDSTRRPPGGTVYEDDYWQADHGTPPLVQRYLVLKPKRHVEDGADLRPDEAAAFGPAAQRLLRAMRAALEPERIYLCSFGEGVRHLHFHLLPRYAGMSGLGPSLTKPLFEGRWRCTDEEAEEAAQRVREVLSTEGDGPGGRDAVADTPA